jgi:amino acid adenylation domain-containing protein
VKDYRKRLAGKGRPYFAYQLLTAKGRAEYGHGWPVEVAFNYLGQMQHLDRTDTVLQSFDSAGGPSVNSSCDIGKDVPRFALIEVSALVTGGRMKLSFAYNKHMKHQDSLGRWVTECESLLRESPRLLMQHTPEKTLSDFPLLPLGYYGMENLDDRLREAGLNVQEVQDVYPCTSMQRGLLLSQMRDPDKYAYKAVFEVESSRRDEVNLERLCDAWQAVVRRHAPLRTIFVDTVGDEGLMDQVVLGNATGRSQVLHCRGNSDHEILDALSSVPSLDYKEKKPPSFLTICTSPDGRIFCRLEISHTICDGSSLPILLGDLADAYDGGSPRVANKPVPLYRDYMAYVQAQPRGESVRYWKEYLSGAEPCLFPALVDGHTDAEPSLGSYAVNLINVAEINDYCADSGMTLSTLLQFVWAMVVRAYTGVDEVMFGYLASGRDVPVANIEHAVGAFINMLVCRMCISPELEIGEALDTMGADLADAMAHQSCSLAEIQHELHLPGAALFNTAFTYQKRTSATRAQESQRSVLQYRLLTADDPSEYTVAVNVEATSDAVEVHFGYWRNMVSDAQIKNIAATFEQVLGDLVADGRDDRTVGEVNLVGSTGIRQICSWNDYELPCVEECVHEVIAQNALQRPSATALCGWDASFTYWELDSAAAALAQHLICMGGVGPDVFVPLCFEKSAWIVVAQIAVLKAGGAFVNLDPSHPDSRVKELIQDVGAKVVLCSAKHKARIDKFATRAFVVDAPSMAALSHHEASRGVEAPATSRAQPYNAAYIIFTSGTTGKPKGTVIEHGAFCTGAIAHAKAMFMHSDSRVLQFASYAFDASVMETLSCLLVGGCACIPSDEDKMNDLGAVIRNMGVTWTLLTPSVASTVRPETVPCLETLVTGGESMAPGHIERWGTRCALVNAYGPTECSVVATTSTKVDEAHRLCNADRANIGKAVGGRLWVVDPHNPDCLMPVGAVGELVIEGRLVARGYLNNEEQTAKAFIQAPAWTKHAGFPDSMWPFRENRMYRTGDLVRYNSDGSVSYLARKDTQVKLNGRRVELGEIEFYCRTGLPEDAQAAVEVVVPPNNRAAAKSLAVFFSLPLQSSNKPSTTAFSLLPMSEALRKLATGLDSHLSERLPAYMVPQLFVPVSVMPWTSAGKLDRPQLRQALEGASKEAVAGYRLSVAAAAMKRHAPASEMERTLQSLWEGVLGLAAGTVGAEDSFFRLGGDSLTAMRLVGTARARKMSLSVLDIFEKPILADMALACGSSDAASNMDLKPFDLVPCATSKLDSLMHEVSSQCQLSRDQIQDVYPCSPLQEGLVALANKQTGAYVAVNTLKLPQSVDLGRFKAAWQEVADETDMLRTRIVHTATSGFLQILVAPEPIDWHNESIDEAIANGKRLGLQNGGPLIRYSVVEGQEGQTQCGHQFVWAIHHALYDGWSLPLVSRRVQDVFNRFSRQSKEALTLHRAPYASFIRYLGCRNIADSERFWADTLAGASSITQFPQLSPTMAKQGETPSFLVETYEFKVSRSDIFLGITVPTLIRAAWAILLAAYTGTDDVVFGETLAGRNVDVPGITEMAGPTFTTVPARVRLGHDMRVVELLQNMQAMASRVVPHQHLGLQHIKKINPDCSAACEFRNLLVIQASSPFRQQDDDQQRAQGATAWNFDGGSSMESFFTHPLVLECNVTDSSIVGTLHYDGKALSPWNAKQLIHQLAAVLKQLAERSRFTEATVADIHVISSQDQRVISRWNRSSKPEDAVVNSCIHHLFLEQASAQPDRVGISAWDAELTYAEIRHHALRLSLRLRELGVTEESLVPVCLERSAWAVVTLLAILMSGGAFVPLDPAHPLARQKEMLESIAPSLIVCSPEHASRFAGIVDLCLSVDDTMIRNLPPLTPRESSARTRSSTIGDPNTTAYVLFTSGSTGRPKGVVVAHRDICSSSRGYARATNMDASSRVFHFGSLTFDVALMEVLTPLTLGACVCIPTGEERLHNLGNAMARLGATWAFLTPSVANQLDPDTVCPTLKTLVCGGEAMVSQTITTWADRVELMNGYGPTETSVLVVINPHVSTERDPGIIGHAHSAARTWILETREGYDDRLAPVGAVGELAISGPLLARGYLHDPEKTARVFVEDPAWAKAFGAIGPARIYHTGDLVRYRSDGSLEYLGRMDGQVKVNGQRIELGEIESRLSADQYVSLGLVVYSRTGPYKKQLVGVVTLNSFKTVSSGGEGIISMASGSTDGSNDGCHPVDGSPERLAQARSELAEVRSRLADILPTHMVPASWIVLAKMPVLVSGKLDRQRVAHWVEGLDDTTYERIASSLGTSGEGDEEVHLNEQARTLREIWAQELRLPVDRVKVNQSFLSLGKSFFSLMACPTPIPATEWL